MVTLQEEEDVTIKTLADVNERERQAVLLDKLIQPDTEKDANLQEAVMNEGLRQETNDAHNFQAQHVISDKVDNQRSDQVFVQPTEERSKTNLINPASFLIHSLNKTDDLVNESSDKTTPKDKFAEESTRDTKYDLTDVPSDAISGEVDLEEDVVDLNSDDRANESESDGIEQGEGKESGRMEEEPGELDERDLMGETRPSSVESYEAEASKIVEVRLGEQVIKEEVKLGSGGVGGEQEKSKVGLVRLGAPGDLPVEAIKQRPGVDPPFSIHQNAQISKQPQKDSISLEKDIREMTISEPDQIGEAKSTPSTSEDLFEETTTTLTIDTTGESFKGQHSTESLTEKVPNLFQLKYESEKKQNQVLDILQANLNREETETVEAENAVETTTLNRRLPEFYPGTHQSTINILIFNTTFHPQHSSKK